MGQCSAPDKFSKNMLKFDRFMGKKVEFLPFLAHRACERSTSYNSYPNSLKIQYNIIHDQCSAPDSNFQNPFSIYISHGRHYPIFYFSLYINFYGNYCPNSSFQDQICMVNDSPAVYFNHLPIFKMARFGHLGLGGTPVEGDTNVVASDEECLVLDYYFDRGVTLKLQSRS